jgi:hypothetical protein
LLLVTLLLVLDSSLARSISQFSASANHELMRPRGSNSSKQALACERYTHDPSRSDPDPDPTVLALCAANETESDPQKRISPLASISPPHDSPARADRILSLFFLRTSSAFLRAKTSAMGASV